MEGETKVKEAEVVAPKTEEPKKTEVVKEVPKKNKAERHPTSSPSQERRTTKAVTQPIKPETVKTGIRRPPTTVEKLEDEEESEGDEDINTSDEESAEETSPQSKKIDQQFKKWPVFPAFINRDHVDAEWLIYQLALQNKKTSEDSIKKLVAEVHHKSVNFAMSTKKIGNLRARGHRLEGPRIQGHMADCAKLRSELLDILNLTDKN